MISHELYHALIHIHTNVMLEALKAEADAQTLIKQGLVGYDWMPRTIAEKLREIMRDIEKLTAQYVPEDPFDLINTKAPVNYELEIPEDIPF